MNKIIMFTNKIDLLMTNFSVLVFVKSMLNEKLMPNIQVFEKKQLNVNVT